MPDTTAQAGATILAELRQESALRLRALRERPAPGTVPSQFLSLSPRTRHAIAVDTSRARLYLFENTPTGLKLLADYYISVGKLGIEKSAEGDLRTPLGVYFITSNLDPRSLTDFYGAGALPINYPNQLDIKRGKTGGGIWLHGAPSNQFARAPLSTEGCVALANPDLQRIIKTVEIGTTPVVIAQSLRWYAPDFTSFGKTLAQFTPVLQAEVKQLAGRAVDIKDVSYLRWIDSSDTMVVTLGEVVRGARTGRTKRQYWARQGNQWKIFFEGVI
ncbi:MAG: hypothetical protein B7Y03_11280 [Polaromonas sp. 24-62-144]|nr:MAG: hypothetical protein B7Y03_11280 [Polaromonas sp. 24-62-144]